MLLFSLVILIFLVFKPARITRPFTKERSRVLKALLPIGVIIHHFFKMHEVVFITEDTQSLGSYIVAIFFFISGYGLSCKYVKNKTVCLLYFISQMKRLFVPLLFVAVIYHSMNYLLCGVSFDYLSVAHNWILGAPPLPYTWFVMTYTSLLILFALSIKQNHWGGYLLVAILMYILIESQLFNKTIPFHHYSSVLAFYAGNIYHVLEHRIHHMNKHLKICLLFIGISAIIVISLLSYYRVMVCGKQGFFLSFLFSFLFIFLFRNIRIPKTGSVINFLSSISYEQYLCQFVSFIIVKCWMGENIVFVQLPLLIMVNMIIAYIVTKCMILFKLFKQSIKLQYGH